MFQGALMVPGAVLGTTLLETFENDCRHPNSSAFHHAPNKIAKTLNDEYLNYFIYIWFLGEPLAMLGTTLLDAFVKDFARLCQVNIQYPKIWQKHFLTRLFEYLSPICQMNSQHLFANKFNKKLLYQNQRIIKKIKPSQVSKTSLFGNLALD